MAHTMTPMVQSQPYWPNYETKQHRGHFNISQTPHHVYASHQMSQSHQFPSVPVLPSSPLPSTPVFSRPSSSCSQPPMNNNSKPSFTSAPAQVLTPQASPVRMHQQLNRPTIVLDTAEKWDHEAHMCYPQTPALSTAGSVISSPGSCDMLSTPLNPMFSGLDGTAMAFKEVEDVQPVEQFPNMGDWQNCVSPPMTPCEFTPI